MTTGLHQPQSYMHLSSIVILSVVGQAILAIPVPPNIDGSFPPLFDDQCCCADGCHAVHDLAASYEIGPSNVLGPNGKTLSGFEATAHASSSTARLEYASEYRNNN